MEQLQRLELLIGKEAIEKLNNARVAIFGLGGVGSFVAESLARSGIGELHIIDKDIIDITNINRQLYALHSTIGQKKVEVAKARILDINPNANVFTYIKNFNNEKFDFSFEKMNYIIDAIDDVDAKIELIKKAKEFNVPIISAMGAGNKLDPTKFKIVDISETHTCPLAKIIRKKLKEANISNVKVVFSAEKPIETGIATISSCAFVPSVAGLIISSEVVKDLINN